jgi:hypothetical protein
MQKLLPPLPINPVPQLELEASQSNVEIPGDVNL